ncbi:MAG: phenylalanine--tRNA ligase subunit beta [Candidatus Bathyarchaeota archaeon]|nr:MAG: phenylalanine--tRNA ligase subunit beta [Candidatus Bathyarchaeota archaeon]
MPTIEVERRDFEALLESELPRDIEELDDMLAYVKGEVKYLDEQEVHVEVKDSNRPDLWSVEGLARALRGFLNLEKGLKNYFIAGSSGVEIDVDLRLKNIRPYIGCAVLRGIKFTDMMIRGAMRLQDKLDQTYGRNRRRTSIGLYDFDLISPPLHYSVAKPKRVSFVPLGFGEKMTLKEILEKHPKGIEYGHIVRSHAVWPLLSDLKDNVLSFPPIINSNDLGRIIENTRNVLVEVTGTSYETVLNTLNMMVTALADRGGKILTTKVRYPYKERKNAITPQLETKTMRIDLADTNLLFGFKLTAKQATDLLGKARYGIGRTQKNRISVKIPCYRIDIMNPVDIAEDIAIAYGYNNIKPREQRLPTTGSLSPHAQFCDLVRELMVGLGFQEILTFTMTNPETLQTKMNKKREKVVKIANPRMVTYTCLRDWLLPSLMEFLSHNTHVEYPQKIFEVGYVIVFNGQTESKTRDVTKLACATTHPNANFTEIKSIVEALLVNIGAKRWEMKATRHPSFLEGRVAAVHVERRKVGVFGEIHPEVINNFELENPVGAFEIDLEQV